MLNSLWRYHFFKKIKHCSLALTSADVGVGKNTETEKGITVKKPHKQLQKFVLIKDLRSDSLHF